jgi:hypothetical protein
MASQHWHDRYNKLIEERTAELEQRIGIEEDGDWVSIDGYECHARLVGARYADLPTHERRDAKVMIIIGVLELHEDGVLASGF